MTMADQAHGSTSADVAVLDSRQPRGKVRLLVVAALAVGALVTVSVGFLERHLANSPHPISYFHLFFSDPLYMKAWLASSALVLSFGQLITAAGMYGLFRISTATRFYQVTHRWSGRVAIALTLPVAFNCLFDLGVYPVDMRTMIHSILGAFIYGIFVAKFLIIRVERAPGWLLPILGSALFATVLGLWITSAYWLFSLYGWHL
jgi:hypothetical protein